MTRWFGLSITGAIVIVGLLFASGSQADNVEKFNADQALHWSDEGGATAFVWLIDHTGESWPVLQAASVWNRTPKITITYVYEPGNQCPKHCVNVRAVDLGTCSGDSILYGRTPPEYTQQSGHLLGGTEVKFNNRCANGLNDDGRRELVCHELGHAVGWIGHRAGGCMRVGKIDNPFQRQPSEHDFDMFSQKLYDHND